MVTSVDGVRPKPRYKLPVQVDQEQSLEFVSGVNKVYEDVRVLKHPKRVHPTEGSRIGHEIVSQG